jgi:hypothetical protein
VNRILVALCLVVALTGAVFAGPFIGVEIVPSGSYAAPYLAVGWDSGSWIKTTFSMNNPFVADGWYGLSVSPLYSLTPSWRIGGGATVWTQMCDWAFTDIRWAAGIEAVGKWKGVMGWVKFNLPMYEISSSAPFFGAWVVIGVAFDFFPCCISPTPVCPDLGAGCQ